VVPGKATPRIDVVGLGPAGPELITTETRALLDRGGPVFLRTSRHPSAVGVNPTGSFDRHYEQAATVEEVYPAIVDDLLGVAIAQGDVVYAVPGSPSVAERSVVLLSGHEAVRSGQVELAVHPAVSFVDLAAVRLGIDPVGSGVRLADGEAFAVDAAGERGPLLVAQCWSPAILSEIKLSVESPPELPVTVLHHLGLADERIWDVPWEELDRSVEPDHLTSLWIPELTAPVARELVALDELVRTLRARCPWDRVQTHASLARHLLEEAHEVLDAIDAVAALDAMETEAEVVDTPTPVTSTAAIDHLEEELGDLLFQVYFHATLAAEAGRFTLADVARSVHDKLVARHPHVFAAVGDRTTEQLASDWEAIKKEEKSRTSVTEGIPATLPALAVAAKLQRKALAVDMVLPSVADDALAIANGVAGLEAEWRARQALAAEASTATQGATDVSEIGNLLFSLVNLARVLGVDPEGALASRVRRFRAEVERYG
jgi:tetrapyrrole methylase family protein / MazG family protein